MVPLAASTSAMVGMEGAAPGRDTARAEAREAFSRQRGDVLPPGQGGQEEAGEGVPGGGGVHRLHPVGPVGVGVLPVPVHHAPLPQGEHHPGVGPAGEESVQNSPGLALSGEGLALHLVDEENGHLLKGEPPSAAPR